MKRGKDDRVAYEGRGRRREWKEEEERKKKGQGKRERLWDGKVEQKRGEKELFTTFVKRYKQEWEGEGGIVEKGRRWRRKGRGGRRLCDKRRKRGRGWEWEWQQKWERGWGWEKKGEGTGREREGNGKGRRREREHRIGRR
jgi:hypothetical protein